MTALQFTIDASRPASRHLDLQLEVDLARLPRTGAGGAQSATTAPGTVELFLPTWTPGSYLVREFARHVTGFAAVDADSGQPLAWRKTRKNRFAIAAAPGVTRLRIGYRVYAHELSVRTADVDAHHAYWNHACLLLWPVGAKELPARITVRFPQGWQLACALPAAAAAAASDAAVAVATLLAEDADHAYDAPCLVGTFHRIAWDVDGVPHEIALDGLGPIAPPANLIPDLTAIVRCAQQVFGDRVPYERYLFLALFADEGHGGLEHRDSCTLLWARTGLATSAGYRDFLSLAAHELFHAWNGKRMRPVEFWQYDYEQENYTRWLWLVEGWTAYYDDLLVARAGRMSATEYLAAVAKNIQSMRDSHGRHVMSLEDSSFDAWIRLYRPDENTRNSSQNYYVNGAVAALCLDLFLRRTTHGQRSLDDVIRALYAATYCRDRGYAMADVEAALNAIAGPAAAELLHTLVARPLDPDLAPILAAVGVRIAERDRDKPTLGVTFAAGSTTIAAVAEGSNAWTAGLAPGDEILAIAGHRVTAATWQDVFRAVAPQKDLDLLVARRGLVRNLRTAIGPGRGTIELEADPEATPEQRALAAGWLGQPLPVSS